MRLIRVLCGVVAWSCLVLSPAFAGQRGPHSVPAHEPAHASAPANQKQAEAHSAPIPVSQKIVANPALVTRLQPLLPSGMTLQTAATGFRNQGQFIAALHVAHNLNIPFAQLKAEMTGSDHDSLGQAIHALQPAADVKVAVKTAEQETRTDLKASRPPKAETDQDDR